MLPDTFRDTVIRRDLDARLDPRDHHHMKQQPTIRPELMKKARELEETKKLPLAEQLSRAIYGSKELEAEIEKALNE